MKHIIAAWGNEERTILWVQFQHGWTWDDLYEAIETTYAMTETVNHNIDLLVDFRAGERVPQGAFAQFHRMKGVQHPRWAFHVMLARSNFIGVLLDVFSKVAPQLQYRVVSTAEEAHTILSKRHEHVPEL